MAEWITVREAAAILDVHMSAVPKMVRRGDLTSRDQRPVLNRADVMAYRAARRAAQAAAQERTDQAGPQPPDGDHDWLNSAQAAEVMGISRVAVNARALRGRIPSVTYQRRRWYRRDHLELVLRAHAAKQTRNPLT